MSPELAELVIEPAREADADAIQALVRQARINPTSLDWRNFLVARCPDGDLAGCGQIRDMPMRGGREVKSLVVRPEYRDGRLARALLRALAEGETGVIWGTCSPSLARYYQRLGCEMPLKREIPRYYTVMGVGVALMRILTRGRMPKMVALRFDAAEWRRRESEALRPGF